MMTTPTKNFSATFNAVCKRCGYKLHVHTEDYHPNSTQIVLTADTGTQLAIGEWAGFGILNNYGPIAVHNCQGTMKRLRLVQVRGTYNPRHVCNARCMASTGPACECSCGGKNHGASFSA